MSKYLLPLVFLLAATGVSAQPDAPPVPVYDPQGRLIPYDVKPEPLMEAPAPVKKPAQAGKSKQGKKSVGAKSKSKSAAKAGAKSTPKSKKSAGTAKSGKGTKTKSATSKSR